MHEDRVRPRQREKRVVHLVFAKIPAAYGALLFLAHAGPHVGVNGVRAAYRLGRVVHNRERRARNRGQPFGLRHDVRVRRVPLRASQRKIHAQPQCAQHQRVRHVVPIPDERQLEALQFAEALADGLHIGQRLAGVEQIAQGVDHRHGRPFGQPIDGLLPEHPGDDAVHPAVQVARHVLQRLAHADRRLEKQRIAAQLFDGQLERQPRAQRGLLKQQRDGLARQRLRIIPRRPLDRGRQVQQITQLVVGQVQVPEQVRGMRFHNPARVRNLA